MATIPHLSPFHHLNLLSHKQHTSCSLHPHHSNPSSYSTFKVPLLPSTLSSTATATATRTLTPRQPGHRSLLIASALKGFLEADLVFLAAAAGDEPNFTSGPGVYAVYDQNEELQFIGISRNVAASISFHWKSVPDLCVSVKVGVVDEPDRTTLTEAWKSWMEAHIAATGKVPPGNEKGNTTWVRPPPKRKPDIRLTPGRHVELTVPLEQLIDRLVKENKVVAFIKGSRSAPLCGFSQRVIGILETQGVEYESIDVLDEEYNYGLRETLKKYSNWPTFPQVFVNGELIGGCDILTSIYEKGELSDLFKN